MFYGFFSDIFLLHTGEKSFNFRCHLKSIVAFSVIVDLLSVYKSTVFLVNWVS